MNPLNFTLAQIEAFASVCETGTLTHAAKKLRKDRTTVSELVEYLEMDLGYALFDRSSRPLKLTEAGERLWRQAQLFLHEAQMFSQVARQIPEHLSARLTLCYDPFTPRDFLLRLQGALAMRQIRVDLLLGERGDAQRWLAEGSVDVGIFQALNRSINESLQWRSVGSISLAVYARRGFLTKARYRYSTWRRERSLCRSASCRNGSNCACKLPMTFSELTMQKCCVNFCVPVRAGPFYLSICALNAGRILCEWKPR
ncbi:LysR family transcriptional regulator [Apirhabdus apintestini]|nr:LysR family transcriptional regulator [Enterobacteriaceae bacterium CA-0114]